MFARICVAVGALMLLASGTRAESIQCAGIDPDGKSEYAFRIIAEKNGTPRVWFAFDPAKLMESRADVLHHFYTGMPDSNGLGASTILIRQRNENGKLMMPAMIVVDWMRARLAVSYVPFLSATNLLVVRQDFDCARLD